MSFSQVQLVKWSLPAFALILGLLWYKRRRVDRVDPGGASKLKGDTDNVGASTPKIAGNLCDSGINTDDSFSLITSTSSPIEGAISPRKVSESLEIPNRRSSSQSLCMLSCKSIELDSTPWYDDADNTPEMREIQLGSNPAKSGYDFMSKGGGKSSSEQLRHGGAGKSCNVIEEEAIVVKANGTDARRQQQTMTTMTTSVSAVAVATQCSNFDNCEKPMGVDDEQHQQTSSVVVVGEEKKEQHQQQRQALSERDSANHSPVSGVLEGSVTDEARSEGSTDSGKGGSIKEHMKDTSRSVYKFYIPTKFVGKLIGRGGKFLQYIRNNADVDIIVKRHATDRDLKVCSITGTPECLSIALEIIRQNFPEKYFPHLTLEPVDYIQDEPEEIPWLPEFMQLSLVEGVNNDVIVSYIVKPNHLFIQLPTHPTYPSLKVLDMKLTQLYETVESPQAPDVLTRGMILVAKWFNKWVRIFVENPDPKGEQTLVRLVDHGGYATFSNSEMRKIRSDYLLLPFQSIEVFLANIQSKEEEWSQEAYNVVLQMCSGIVGQAQIVGYIDCNTIINLYFNIPKHGVISIADELVARGLAEPSPLEDVVLQEGYPSV